MGTPTRRFASRTSAILLVATVMAGAAQKYDPTLIMTDAQLFTALDLDRPELVTVKACAAKQDYSGARQALHTYFRTRQGRFWWFDPADRPGTPQKPGPCYRAVRDLRDRKGGFPADRFLPDGELDWHHKGWSGKWPRLYSWQSFGIGYWESGCQEWAAEEWVSLLQSFVRQCPIEHGDVYWSTMVVGIQLRTGWPHAFSYFLHSEAFTPEAMALFLKGTLQRARFLREKHSKTSNWLTFEMAGLYCTGVLYPEFREASDWRGHAVKIAVDDMLAGYLPDGSSIELSPGYHQFFSNYLHMARLAQATGRLQEDGLDRLTQRCEKPFEYYLRLLGPDGFLPAFNDNGPIRAADKLASALELFPDRTDFAWGASGGAKGTAPDYTSCFLPYAGAGAMRSGWTGTDHCLILDFGPVGYRHAHQDKLNLVLWAYGRQVLFDPGCGNYDDTADTRYCRDTFSHNTVLVDNRPQRRRWYQHPNPQRMPYRKLTDVQWESTDTHDVAVGVYNGAYGKPGPSDSYPYKKGGDFLEGWGKPAVHHRQILFLKPDVFVVWDRLESLDGESHEYDLRWHLDTTRTVRDGETVRSSDADQPNLEIVPLAAQPPDVRVTSAQREPELLGWHVLRKSRPATTIQHMRTGKTAEFLTLLLPLQPGAAGRLRDVHRLADHAGGWQVTFQDGRQAELRAPSTTTAKLRAAWQQNRR